MLQSRLRNLATNIRVAFHQGQTFAKEKDATPLHSGSKWLKPATKSSWLAVISRIFLQVKCSRFTSFPFPAIALTSFPKICQTVAGISTYDQSISRFFLSNFWWVSVIWSNCAPLISTTLATRACEVSRLAIELMPLSKPQRVPLSFW